MCLGSPRPKETLFKWEGGKVNCALKTPVWADRDGGCTPLLSSGFPAKQMFTDKTEQSPYKGRIVLPVKGKVWGKFYARLYSLYVFICIFISTVVELI